MGVIYYTAPMLTARLPSWRQPPHILAETASLLAVLLANERCTRVLLLTGCEPKLVENSTIRRKPGAIQVVIGEGGWWKTHRTIDEFCQNINEPRSGIVRLRSTYRPVVIVNDVDYFIAEGGVAGQFARTSDPLLLTRVDTLARLLEEGGGELVLMAVLDKSAEGRWSEVVEEKGWQWRRNNDLTAGIPRLPGSQKSRAPRAAVTSVQSRRRKPVPAWCHQPVEIPPPTFQFGPLVGSLEELASWLFQDRKRDRRRVFMRVRDKVIWVRMVHTRSYEAYFNNPKTFAQTNRRRLDDEQGTNGAALNTPR